MYVATIPNRGSTPTIIIREGYREGGKVKNRTIANITHWPAEQVEALRLVLKGKRVAEVDQVFEKLDSRHHGHVHAVLLAVRQLGLDTLIAAKPCRERDLIVGALVARICEPDSKLAMTRWWQDTTLPELLDLEEVDEDDLYEAMDWLLGRQQRIEKKLARRHLAEGDLVLYDLTSSYFEGETCPLARRGKSRDRKQGTLQVNYGLVADRRGVPVAVSVFEGNTGDATTLLEQAERVRTEFGIQKLVLVGDRGMISQKQIEVLRQSEGVDWITALKSAGIHKLVQGGALQLDLFDERNLFEFVHEDFPGERLVACRNPVLARKRAYKRSSLLEATTRELDKVRGMVEHGRLQGADAIGVRVGKVVNKYKMAKHVVLAIDDHAFDFRLDEESIATEAVLDGIYVIRTAVPAEQMTADEAVRSYKDLTGVERAFKSLKSIDLLVRPIRHRTENRVRAHIFFCMLTYYVYRHMFEALRPLLFADEDLEAKQTRDPVAPAKRSQKARDKARTKTLDDGSVAHSFRTLLHHMSTITRDRCRQHGDAGDAHIFTLDTTPNDKQRRVLELLSQIAV